MFNPVSLSLVIRAVWRSYRPSLACVYPLRTMNRYFSVSLIRFQAQKPAANPKQPTPIVGGATKAADASNFASQSTCAASTAESQRTPEQINPHLFVPSDPQRAAQVSKARAKFEPEALEAARIARLARLGWVGNLPEKWIPYAELMRLEKPVGTLLLLIPCFWGITMAAYAIHAPFLVAAKATVLFSIGALIMRGAGCTINDIFDRDLDNQVSRTMERPIASGRVSVPQATSWMVVQGLAGLGVLLLLPALCFWLGVWLLPFVAAYPLFKRFTNYPQFMFSICFSWGILLGFPAVGAPLDWAVAGPMFVANWIWGIVYDTIYAHQDKAYDIHAGIKLTALAWQERTKPILTGLTAVQAGLWTAAGVANAMGPGFYAGAAWGFYRIFSMIKKVDLDNEASCWKAFTGNIKTGFVFWFGILIDYLAQLAGFL